MRTATILNDRQITSDGTIMVRFAKQIVAVDGAVMASEWHRAILPPGCDIDAVLALVSDHLEAMNFPRLAAADCAAIKDLANLIWTPNVLASYQAATQAETAALQERMTGTPR